MCASFVLRQLRSKGERARKRRERHTQKDRKTERRGETVSSPKYAVGAQIETHMSDRLSAAMHMNRADPGMAMGFIMLFAHALFPFWAMSKV